MAESRNPLLGLPGQEVDESGKPPTAEIGAQVQSPGGLGGWATFLDEAERVPDLTFPASVQTYHKMRSDSQIEALHLGTTQPIREYRWMIDPNGAPKSIVENAATDLGLPIKGEDDDVNVKRSAARFAFDRWLDDALLAPLYGFMHFEIVGRIEEALDWRMTKLAPRHPRTIMQFKTTQQGDLEAIKQYFAPDLAMIPQPIPASKLVSLVWRPEAGSQVGRSMLRSMYREWLVKDKTLRLAVVNIERGGGVPVITGAQGASDPQIEQLAQMARQFKVSEGGAGAIPFGTSLQMVGGSVPDSISLIRYCDEAMARVWALMLVQLGQTDTGSRALGGEFAIYAARAQRLMAKWVCDSGNDFLDRYTEWNEPLADYAPRLAFEPSKPEGLSVTDLVALLDAGAITVDPEFEEWLRAEFNLPDKPEPQTDPELGELSDSEVSLVQNSRNPPTLPDGTPNPDHKVEPGGPTFVQTPGPRKAEDLTVNLPTIASRSLTRLRGGVRASLTLPGRELRREPSANEIRAAVDFKALDETHSQTVARLHHDYLNGTLPTQIASVADQLRNGVKAADLGAPVVRLEQLKGHLATAAESGVNTALREAEAQGVVIPDHVAEQALAGARAKAAVQAEHVATLNANGLSLGAQRRAGRLAAKVGGREAVAKDLEAHLTGQKHVFERENLKGAVTVAQNGGRNEVFSALEPTQPTATYEASEILDDRTCGPCEAIDGKTYDTVEEAEADYPTGGYVDCEGGPNCRGTLVAIYGEQNPVGGDNRLREAEPAYNGTDPRGDGGLPPSDEGVVPPMPGTPTATPPPQPEPTQTAPEPAPAAPAPEPAPAPAAAPESGAAGPLLSKARQVGSHDDAVAFFRDEIGIPETNIRLGGKMERAASESNRNPVQREQAVGYLRQMAESVGEARDVFGEKATKLHSVVAKSELRETPMAKAKVGQALAAVITMTNRFTGDYTVNLFFNDSRSFSDMAATDLFEKTGGFITQATTDARGQFMHEMAHVMEDGLPGFSSALPRLLAESGIASSASVRGVARQISQYAATKSAEAWAESFATMMKSDGIGGADFGLKTDNARLLELSASDEVVKERLVKFRELVNAWIAEHHSDVNPIPAR